MNPCLSLLSAEDLVPCDLQREMFSREQGAEMVATVWKVNAFKPTEPSTYLRCVSSLPEEQTGKP